MKYTVKINNGQITDTEYIKQLAKWNGKEVRIDIKLHKPTRSNNQNEYYWKIVIGLISEQTGYTPDEVHEILKQEFIGKPLNVGEKTYNIATTTNQTTVEFEQYLSKIRQWASITLGVYIPLPNHWE